MTEDTDMTAPRTVKITVFTPGSYAGKRHAPGPDGVVLEVTPHAAAQFRQRGACRRPDAPGAAPAADPDAPTDLPEVPPPRPSRRLWPKD